MRGVSYLNKSKQYIYFDNAATTKIDDQALSEMIELLKSQFANASQLYSISREPKRILRKAREIISECIGSLPEEIYFTSGGSESNNWAIKGTKPKETRNEVIISSFEHHAVLNT